MGTKENVLIQGDAYKLIKELENDSVDCIYTDIPYFCKNGPSDGNSPISKRIHKNRKGIKHIYNGIDFSILEEFERVMKHINLFIWCSKEQVLPIWNYFDRKDVFVNLLFWGKTNPVPINMSPWLSDKEICLHIREKGVWYSYEYNRKKTYHIEPLNVSDKEKYGHPTIKPYNVVKSHILNMTQKGETVLDPFCGSGTTLEVAKDTGRKYIGFEIEEEYYNIAKNRLNGIEKSGQMSIFTDFENV